MEKTIKKYNIGHRYSEPPYECDINYTEDGDFLLFHSRKMVERDKDNRMQDINQFQTTDLNYLRFINEVLNDQLECDNRYNVLRMRLSRFARWCLLPDSEDLVNRYMEEML